MKYRILVPLLFLFGLGGLFFLSHDISSDTQHSAPTQIPSEGIHF